METVFAASWIPVLATFAAQGRGGVRGVAWDPGAQLEWEGSRVLRPGAQLEWKVGCAAGMGGQAGLATRRAAGMGSRVRS